MQAKPSTLLLLALALVACREGGAPEPPATGQGALAARARAAWGAAALDEQTLALPDGRPAAFAVDVRQGAQSWRLVLERHSLRAPGAVLRVQLPGGSYREEALPPPATYRGHVDGLPESVVLASLEDTGLSADVILPGDLRWCVRPLAKLDPGRPRAAHGVFEATHEPWSDPPCGAVGGGEPSLAGILPVQQQPVPPCLKLCEIAFDADFEYFQLKGSSVGAVVDAVDAIMNQVDLFYARDVLITYAVTGYVVRTAPFYAPTSGGDLLDQFEAEWAANQTSIPYDIAHLMTAKPGSLIQYGGLGQVGVVCNPGYAWSMDGANIVGHEVGHNWGASHCHDPVPCNNMCGACFYIAPKTKDIISAFRDTRTCLDDAGPYATPLPPYAHPDRVTLEKDELDGLGELEVAVLANDHDANCSPVRLESFDRVGTKGGRLRRAAPGPRRRDVLVYTPTRVFVGEDVFHYVVSDGALSTEGTLTIDVKPTDLVARWGLDEGAGTALFDSAPGAHHGETVGGPVWVAGPFGTALQFDGVDDSGVLPPLDLDDDSVTITTWMRRDGLQNSQAGVVFSRDGTTVSGLQLSTAGLLGLTWNRTVWSGGPATPDGDWVFAAMVIEPGRETLYLYDGALQSATQAAAHAPEAFDGELRLAFDDYFQGNRHFAGALDEVRVYDYPLDAAEIADLAQRGGRAAAPAPRDGGWAADAAEPLTWVGSPLAATRDVYLGTSYAAVRDATPASPELLGSTTQETFPPGSLAYGSTYYWRVDEHVGPDVLTGPVWEFHLADYRHWPLDELSGTTAFAARGAEDGTYVGGLLGQPGASLSLGTSVTFDGATERVEIPALHLDSNQLTFTAWVRRDGTQNVLAGIVCARDADTLSGIHVEGGDELRYHWNDDSATWNFSSGLTLPDGVWVFVALVVEPERATLYRGQEGVLASATNPVFHAEEPFGDLLYLAHDPITVGRRRFRGGIDDVRVYQASLTPGQVRALYDASR